MWDHQAGARCRQSTMSVLDRNRRQIRTGRLNVERALQTSCREKLPNEPRHIHIGVFQQLRRRNNRVSQLFVTAEEVPDGGKRPNSIADDFRDGQHRYGQNCSRHTPHPEPED